MNIVEIYTHPTCSYCHQAKLYLRSKGVNFREINLAQSEHLMQEMQERTGGRTVPQIIIDGEVIGGYRELLDVAREASHPLFN